MRIDFDRMEIFEDVAHTRCNVMSLRKNVADMVYTRGMGNDALALAHKIAEGDGQEEYTERERRMVMAVAVYFCPAIIEAIGKAVGKGGAQ